MKNKLILFVYFLGSLISSTGHIQAQCSTCNFEIKTGSGTLVLSPNDVTCITEDLTFSDIKWANNATLCIAPGKTLTIQNNMDNNIAEYNLTLELYGKLAMGNPEFNSNNLIMNIHSGGEFKTTGNTAFKGSNVIINNQGNFHVSVLNLNGNSGAINILNSESATFKTESNLNVGNNIALIYNNKGYLEIGSQFGLSEISKYSNCGVIKTAGFNLMSGTIYNTGKIFISDKLEGKGEIYNYGTIELKAILGDNKKIYNYGTIDILTNSIVDMEIYGPTEHPYYGEFRWKGQAGGVNNILVFGNQLFKNTDTNGNSSSSGMLQNSSALKPQSGSGINWGDCPECIVVNEGVECIDTETVNPCQEVNLFFEDFGVSEFPEVSNNFGRLTSPYMPSNSFKFGTPYPLTEEYVKYAIDNNHYAVVAPGYIKMGHRANQFYFWTSSYNESNTVHDRSGTQDGAVMVVNAGQVLDSFYKRPQLLQVGASYRASFWLYLVNGPSQVGIDILHQKTNEVLATIESQKLEDWDVNVKHKWNYLEVYFTVPLPDDDKECNVDNIIISFRNNLKQDQGNDYYIDDISLDKVCSVPDGTPIINCPDPNYKKNYWHGTVNNEWTDIDNWTAGFVPATGEDIEFATDVNNGSSGNGNGLGAAIRDLHLDTDREIGDLINNSNVDLLVTTENQLTINGVVKDDNPNKGTIVVKTSTNKATGTLLFSNPSDNRHVNATVEFYNKAYECATCGFYRKQWQYFGIPVQLSDFPYLSPQVETVNQWVEPYIYSNKWRPAPYTPDLTLKAFKGYEMTNSNDTEPTHIYSFPGILNVGDATVGVTKTANVDYSGMNLLSNSFTAAIPITSAAIALGSVELKSNTVYLFNMGTRDQWRKLNGGSAYGVAAGQYQAVPFNLAGQAGIPDRILSMHTFMLDVITPGNITLKYDQLLKNELNASTVKPWKSAELRSSTIQLPHIVMDVISNGSADRVWLFEEADATTEFDNGWDGYKMKEGDLIQTYVLGSDQSDYQIATVPEIIGTTIGVSSGLNENYSINFSVTPDVESRNLFLRDLFTGRNYSIKNNAEYVINGTNNSNNNRFKIVASSSSLIDEDIMSSPINIYVMNNIIIVDNQSEEDCSVMVYDLMGRLVANKQAPKSQITEFTNISQNKTGVYIVKVLGESNSINKTDRVLLR